MVRGEGTRIGGRGKNQQRAGRVVYALEKESGRDTEEGKEPWESD